MNCCSAADRILKTICYDDTSVKTNSQPVCTILQNYELDFDADSLEKG